MASEIFRIRDRVRSGKRGADAEDAFVPRQSARHQGRIRERTDPDGEIQPRPRSCRGCVSLSVASIEIAGCPARNDARCGTTWRRPKAVGAVIFRQPCGTSLKERGEAYAHHAGRRRSWPPARGTWRPISVRCRRVRRTVEQRRSQVVLESGNVARDRRDLDARFAPPPSRSCRDRTERTNDRMAAR